MSWNKLKDRVVRVNVANMLGIIGFFLSLYSIYLTREEHELRLEEYEISQVPLWDLQMDYSDNNLDLTSVQFISKTGNIIPQGFTIYCPSDMSEHSGSDYYGSIWKCADFFSALDEKLHEYVELPKVDILSDGFLDMEVSYPIAIKHRYILGRKPNEYVDIYLVHIKYYTHDKFKVRAFELVDKIAGDKKDEVANILDTLNHKKGFIYQYNIAKKAGEERVLLSTLINLITHKQTFVYTYSNHSQPKENYKYTTTVPVVYNDSVAAEKLETILKSMADIKDKYSINIQQNVNALSSFVKKHPFTISRYKEDKNNVWVKTDIHKEWDLLVDQLLAEYNK